ncbi:MAG: hypothetical protein AB4206_00060 [Xenococcaceae cyanobacterium]
MKLSWFRSQFMLKVCLSLLLVLLVSLGIQGNKSNYVWAQSSTDTFNRAETLNLKREIRQLEAEIRRLNQLNRRSNSLTPTPRSNLNNTPMVNNQPVGSSDPMFQRLANLLIELKEDVKKLDERMTKIEQQVNKLSPQ